jgi:hypothetical protein
MFIFTNTSGTPCSLQGYPGMQMLDSTGSAIPTNVIRGSSVVVPPIPVTLVILGPAASGSFLFGYPNIPTGSQTCPTSTKLEITPPNAFNHFTIADAISPCGGNITVSPVRAGTSRA